MYINNIESSQKAEAPISSDKIDNNWVIET